MDFVSKFSGADAKLVKEIQEHTDVLKTGKILVIDPSSINVGYAYVDNCKIVANGVLKLPPKLAISERLASLVRVISERWPEVDALAIEKIRGNRAHIYLLWAVGVTVAGAEASLLFEIPVSAWNKMRGPDYTKSDTADARMMAKFVIGCLGGDYDKD
jgi:hypothetical protein